MDETTGLENRRAARFRGFESRPLRLISSGLKLSPDSIAATIEPFGGVVKRSKTTVC